jgi:phosphoglycerate dehydrogenase-like enzyme
MEGSQRLRVVAKYTVGVDDVDVEAATELGILVCHAPTEANCFGVAEQTMAFILAILKKVRERDANVRAGKWRLPEDATTFLGRRDRIYAGITIGLVGLGRIGTRWRSSGAWRVRIVAYGLIPPANFLLAGVEAVDYPTLLKESDVVSFHVVLTRETRNMLSEREIALMKPSAVVINTARGKVIDEDALARALAENRLSAAAIDAFAEEPPAPDSPLRALGSKVLMSPHAASYNEGAELGPGIEWATRSVLTALAGNVPDNVYNREVIPRWMERFGGVSVTEAGSQSERPERT